MASFTVDPAAKKKEANKTNNDERKWPPSPAEAIEAARETATALGSPLTKEEEDEIGAEAARRVKEYEDSIGYGKGGKKNSELNVAMPQFTDRDLAALNNITDLDALLKGAGIEVRKASEVMGNGFAVLDTGEKHQLIGVPFVALRWAFRSGDQGNFVSIELMTVKGEKYIVNDGSTGIYKQLRQYTDTTGLQAGLACEKGLRVSEYEKTRDDGTSYAAKTFYIDLSAT
jgi:hypothetical protein